MPITTITSLDHEGVSVFATLTEAQLRNRKDSERGMFIAESPKVIRVALDAGYEPLALLCERRHIEGDAKDIIERCAGIPVYTGERELLARLTGYVLTRGVLCAMRRKAEASVGEVCSGARRVVVIDGVVDTTNIGAIFRSAAALGIRPRKQPQPARVPHGGHGPYGQLGAYRPPRARPRAAPGHSDGHRGRRLASRNHCLDRLRGAHTHGPRR